MGIGRAARRDGGAPARTPAVPPAVSDPAATPVAEPGGARTRGPRTGRAPRPRDPADPPSGPLPAVAAHQLKYRQRA